MRDKQTTKKPARIGSGAPGPGRPKGVPNKATKEVREFTSKLVDSPKYRKQLERRLLDGDLPPLLEQMLWHYAKGKPKDEGGPEHVLVLDVEKLKQLSDADFEIVMKAVAILKAKAALVKESEK